MQCLTRRTSTLAVTALFVSCVSAAAQDYSGREKLRAHSNEFRKEVIRVADIDAQAVLNSLASD